MRPPCICFIACSLIAGFAGCTPFEQTATSPAPNLVLISIDSLRWDGLGCYGAGRETSPAIDALAAEGAMFETVLAPTSWTLPSHVTLFTGLPILAHRVDDPEDRIDPNRRLLAQHLSEFGFRTAGFASAPFLHRAYGFARGFDTYENFGSGRGVSFPPPRESHHESHGDMTAPRVVDAAIEWLDGLPHAIAEIPEDAESTADLDPFFLFVHLWDVHFDYEPPPPYDELFDPDYNGDLDVRNYENNENISASLPAEDREHIRALYDGEIRWVDHHLERLFDVLRNRSDWTRTIVALVSDHGEEFFEHDGKGHFSTVYDESVRVPWILVYPAKIRAGTRVGGVVGLVDVAPTLLGLLGVPALTEATGRNWSGALRAGGRADGSALLTLGDVHALRGDGWKVIHNLGSGKTAYYDLRSDPDEQRPLVPFPESTLELGQRILFTEKHAQSLRWDAEQPVQLDPKTSEQLRRLGYTK